LKIFFNTVLTLSIYKTAMQINGDYVPANNIDNTTDFH